MNMNLFHPDQVLNPPTFSSHQRKTMEQLEVPKLAQAETNAIIAGRRDQTAKSKLFTLGDQIKKMENEALAFAWYKR